MNRTTDYRSNGGGWNINSLAKDAVTAWRLLWDSRVPLALKLMLPGAAMLYWVSPIDLIPGLPFDDIALLLLALRLFVSLAPDAAVENARNPSRPAAGSSGRAEEANTIDTTWRVIDQ